MISSIKDYMNKFNIIQQWDLYQCERHVINNTTYISYLLKENDYLNDLYIIDIGANVGKVYDTLLKSSVFPTKVWMFEANPTLASYISEKYNLFENIEVFNIAVSNKEGFISLEETSLQNQIISNCKADELNLGLSYISAFSQEKTDNINIPSKKISDFINHQHDLFNKKLFIKIDTENADFYILEDLLSIIDRFEYKPLIEFEFNNTNTPEYSESNRAYNLLNTFLQHGYKACVGIDQLRGDGFLIPSHFNHYKT